MILPVIEKPFIKKGYRDLKDYFESLNMKNEAMAIEVLIQKRFNENIHTDNNKEQ